MRLGKNYNLHCMRPLLLLLKLLLVLHNMSTVLTYSDEGACVFPKHWYGQWFQSGVPQSITIESSYLSTKGRCLSSKGDKFILRDERNCYRCVAISERHVNVLQYKETFCQQKNSMQDLCKLINGDDKLYSMFRENSVPVTCPLKGPFTFTYNRGHGECVYPVSNIDSCTEDSRLLLTYQACPDVSGTESRVEELECLATWNNGNVRYLVGKVDHRHAITNEDRFRCFVYAKTVGIGDNALEYKISQSDDATCDVSATDASRTMTLKQAAAPARCRFPNWLTTASHWNSIDQSSVYWFHHRNSSLKVMKGNMLEIQAHCSQINRQTADDVMIILQYSEECSHGFICMHYYRRDNFIVELQIGSRAARLEDACSIKYFDPMLLPYITLISSKPDVQNCPIPGHYIAHGMLPLYDMGNIDSHQIQNRRSADCSDDAYKLHIGCNKRNVMEFNSDCLSNMNTDYSCHGSWIDNGTIFIVATQQYNSVNHTNLCMKIMTADHASKLIIQNTCNRDVALVHAPGVEISLIGHCTSTNSCTSWKSSLVILVIILAVVNR